MAIITTFTGKGSSLTYAEIDANFDNINDETESNSVTLSSASSTDSIDTLVKRDALGNIEVNALNVVDKPITRTNLGLGSVATQGDGDKGDIVVSGSGSNWTIETNSVDFAKTQDINTNKLLGRSSSGIGDIEELSVGSGLNLDSGVLSTLPSTGSLIGYTVYTASTTYVKSTNNPSFVVVELIGGGGGGAGSTTNGAGTPGSGGGYSRKLIQASLLPASVSITIGSGGNAGSYTNNGATGGTTSFGSFCSATGGGGGGAGGGGTGVSGDINGIGGSGTLAIGNRGGGTFFTQHNGGVGYFGTGGSAGNAPTQSGQRGGDGLIIVWEYK